MIPFSESEGSRFGYPSNALFSGSGRREKYHPRRRASAYCTAFALQTADGAGTGTGKATADPWEKTDHPHGRRSSPSETCGRNHRIAGKDRTGTPLGFPGALRQSLPRRRNSRLYSACRFCPLSPALPTTYALVWKKHAMLSAAAQAFMQVLKQP